MKFIPLFDTFDEFLKAFVVGYSTEDAGSYYPKYTRQSEEIDDVDAYYIIHFLRAGLDPQEGLMKFLKAMSRCSRYGADIDFSNHANIFVHHGASIKDATSYLMKTYKPSLIEDFAGKIDMRMMIVDTLWKDLDHDYINSLVDWTSVEPFYWECLKYKYDADEHGNPIDLNKIPPKSQWFFSYMKYHSRMLSGTKAPLCLDACDRDYYKPTKLTDVNETIAEYEEYLNGEVDDDSDSEYSDSEDDASTDCDDYDYEDDSNAEGEDDESDDSSLTDEEIDNALNSFEKDY